MIEVRKCSCCGAHEPTPGSYCTSCQTPFRKNARVFQVDPSTVSMVN